MKQNIFLIILFVLFSNIGFLYSQQKTPYEQRIDFLNKKLLKDLELLDLLNKYENTGDIGSILFLNEFSYRIFNTEKGFLYLLRYNEDVIKAETLKNEIDLKNDKLKIDVENAKKIALKNEIEKKEQIKKYKSSDYYRITENIKNEFENWLLKSEFEKNETYQNRILYKNKEEFDSVCSHILEDEIENYNNYPTLEIGKYDSEIEQFAVKIGINRVIIEELIKVEIANAEHFKNNVFPKLRTTIPKNCNWGFIDNQLMPAIILFENESYKLEILLKSKLIPIIFKSNELSIYDDNFNKLEFDFDNYKKEKEKRIAIENFIYSVNELDSLPTFMGDNKNQFISYLKSRIQPPNSFEDYPIGNVKLSYIIEKNGTISKVEILKYLEDGSGKNLIGLIYNTPKWKPGYKNDKPVRVKDTISISLRKLHLEDVASFTYRKIITLPKVKNKCNENGIIVVKITIDENGKVIEATTDDLKAKHFDERGRVSDYFFSSYNYDNLNISECMKIEAIECALNTIFDSNVEKMKNKDKLGLQEAYFRERNYKKEEGFLYYHFNN